MLASVRRLGLTAYRICMVFSSLRLMDYEGDAPLPATLCCRDDDFRTTLLMMEVLLHHTGLAYKGLQADIKSTPSRATVAGGDQREHRLLQLFEGLPEVFNRAGYQDVARAEGIPVRTADRYVIELCNQGRLQKLDHDAYGKTGK